MEDTLYQLWRTHSIRDEGLTVSVGGLNVSVMEDILYQ